MNKDREPRRHPKQGAIEYRIRSGDTDTSIARELHCARSSVARVRKLLGVAPVTVGTSKADKLDRYSVTTAGGHTAWTGRRNGGDGAPIIRHKGRQYPAAAVAFEGRTGRAPVGNCVAECGIQYCLTPHHLSDMLERRATRSLERVLKGLPWQPWAVCPEGHDWDRHGRIEPDLTTYCGRCNSDRMSAIRTQRSRERRAAIQEEATA